MLKTIKPGEGFYSWFQIHLVDFVFCTDSGYEYNYCLYFNLDSFSFRKENFFYDGPMVCYRFGFLSLCSIDLPY